MLIHICRKTIAANQPPHASPTRRSSDLGQGAGNLWRRSLSDFATGSRLCQGIARSRSALFNGCGDTETLCGAQRDRKSTRLNSSHVENSYAVFCLKKKTEQAPRSVVMR